MKKHMKLSLVLTLGALVLSLMPVSAAYREKGCHSYGCHSCFNDGYHHQCNHYVDYDNDGYCDHCYWINGDTTDKQVIETPLVNTTYNNGDTIPVGGCHHGHHGHHHWH